jgi:hypothetical protein
MCVSWPAAVDVGESVWKSAAAGNREDSLRVSPAVAGAHDTTPDAPSRKSRFVPRGPA